VPVASVMIGAIAGYLGIIAATEAPQQVFDFLVSSSGAVHGIRVRRGCARANLAAPAAGTPGRASAAGQYVAVPLF